MIDRPKRKAIPDRVKRAVVERQRGLCTCGCGRRVEWRKHRKTTRFDHQPAIEFRAVNAAGTDYDPPQLDPDHIIARCVESDRLKTAGKLHTSVGSDAHMAGKIRTLRGENKPKPKRRWKSHGFRSQHRPFPKRQKSWR
jgi:hypothetical protein